MVDFQNTRIDDGILGATHALSGFLYQTKVAILVTLQKIEELLDQGVTDFNEFSIEHEWRDDFSILKGDEYLSLHQVKAKKSTELSDYEEDLKKLQLNLSCRLTGKHLIYFCELAFKNYKDVYAQKKLSSVNRILEGLKSIPLPKTVERVSYYLAGAKVHINFGQAILTYFEEKQKLPTKGKLNSFYGIVYPKKGESQFLKDIMQKIPVWLQANKIINQNHEYAANPVFYPSTFDDNFFLSPQEAKQVMDNIAAFLSRKKTQIKDAMGYFHTINKLEVPKSGILPLLNQNYLHLKDRVHLGDKTCYSQVGIVEAIIAQVKEIRAKLKLKSYLLEDEALTGVLHILVGLFDSHICTRHYWRHQNPGKLPGIAELRIPFQQIFEFIEADNTKWSKAKYTYLLRSRFLRSYATFLADKDRLRLDGDYCNEEEIASQNKVLEKFVREYILRGLGDEDFLIFCQNISPHQTIDDWERDSHNILNEEGLHTVFFAFFSHVVVEESFNKILFLNNNQEVVLPTTIISRNRNKIAKLIWASNVLPKTVYDFDCIVTERIEISDLKAHIDNIFEPGRDKPELIEEYLDPEKGDHMMKRRPRRIISIGKALEEFA